MKKIQGERRKFLANFFMNISVAWFAGGVVGAFVDKSISIKDILFSLFWGIGLSSLSLWFGWHIIGLGYKRK